MEARLVQLEDWEAASIAWTAFKAGPYGAVLSGDESHLRAMFTASLVPDSTIKIFGVFEGRKTCLALGCVEQFVQTDVIDGRLYARPYTYIRSVFSRQNTPRKALMDLLDVVVAWSKSRGHFAIRGNCRLEFPTRLARLYGFAPQSVVYEKELNYGQ